MSDKSRLCLSCGHYIQEDALVNIVYHNKCYEAILDEEDRLCSILQIAREIVEGYKALGGNYYSHRLGCECGGTPDGINYCGKLTKSFRELTKLVDKYDKL